MATGILNNPGAVTPTDPNKIATTAQDVAKAQGVAYEEVAKPTTAATTNSSLFPTYDANRATQDVGSLAQVKQPTSYFDQAKSTVAGQLTALLGSDSPYIKQQENKAKEQSASRGMLNSTLASQAGREAAIGAALPIAQQDASEYNKFALQTQSTQNQQATIQTEAIVSSELAKQNAAIAQSKQNIQNEFTAKLQGASEQSKVWLQDFQNQYDSGVKELDRQHNLLLQREQVSAEKANSIRNSSSQIMQNYQISVENLLTDPDFLNLGPAALQNSISQLQTLASNSINFIGASSGIDMSAFVDAYLEPITIYT